MYTVVRLGWNEGTLVVTDRGDRVCVCEGQNNLHTASRIARLLNADDERQRLESERQSEAARAGG